MLRRIRSCLRFTKHTRKNLSDLNSNQDGNIFFMLFGAVAIVGLLGTAVMSTMRGPLSTMVEIQSRTQAESEMGIASHLALLEATELANSGDCDGDGFVEPLEFADASGLGPVGGGFLPNTVASSRIDPWGTEYGYCAWDAGGTTNAIGCDIDSSGTNDRLDGNGSPTDETYTVIAIISAGPDQVFGTTCTGGANPSIAKTGDDIVVEFTYASANAASNGLWNLKSGDPTTAEISKNLEITGTAAFSENASFGAGIDLSLSTAALQLGAASMLFPNETTLTTCNGANEGLIRINTGADPDFLELCDASNGWVAIGGNLLWSVGAGNDIHYNTGATPQVGIGKTDPSEALDVAGNIDVSGNLDAGGNLIAGGNADITGTLDVTGATTLSTLNASDAVAFASTLGVTGLITGTSGIDIRNTDTSFAVNTAGHYTGDYRFQVPSGTTRNITFRHTSGGWNAAKIEVSKLSGSNHDGTMHLYTTGHGNSQLFLDELGNIGIGTTSPNAQLHVSGSTILTSTLNAQGTISNSTGNINIGDNLDVSGDLDVTGDIDATDITASSDLNAGSTINVNGDQLGPALNCSSSQKLEWNNGAGWSCVTDLQGGGGGGIPALDDLTDVGVTTPADGECLVYNNGSGEWENAPCIGTGAGIFEIVSNVTRVKSTAGDYTNDDFVFGSPQLDDDGDANHDNRLFFDKSKGAFRVGSAASTQWNDSNVGDYSFVAGRDSTATNTYSIAMGQGVDVSGANSIALGRETTVTGQWSFGFGLGNPSGADTLVSGDSSFGIFMGDQSGADLSVSNRMGLYGGDLLIDDDGTSGSQGCIQYNGATSQLEFSDDCTTFTAFGNGTLGLWTDLTGGRIHYGTSSANQVGVGTSNPQTTLDVNGGVRVGSVSGGAAPTFMAINDLSDVAAAVPADGDCLVYNNTSGDWENVACSSLGVGAINDLSDAYTDYVTDFNMYMGDGAGVSSSPGQYNLALGQNALASLDGTCTNAWECDYNIAVGHSALTANTLGSRNVAIGAEALQANTTGLVNVAIGYAALASNTVGSANYYSGNVAVGAWALTSAVSAEHNVAIGERALASTTSGYNTAIGASALESATGAANTALGRYAGLNITTGARNLMIGMGTNAASATGDDQLNIGNVITGDMATGDIAIIGTAALAHPSGTTAQRPSTGVNGMIRYNSTLNEFEGYENGSWVSMGGSAGAGAINDLTDAATDYVTDHNMFFGNTAGNSILAGGNNNVFIGEIAGEDTTSGSYNVFIGKEAGRNNITGEWNTFVGDDAGRANTSGSFNSAFGGYSLRANLGGSQNTAIGDGTLEVNTSGGNNTALGRQALFTSGTGNNNVALGRNALHTSNGASNNTAIGTNAGDNITTGDNNIIIGYNVDAASATGDNQINIGNVITGDMSTGDIAIIGTAALAHPSGTTAQRPSTGVNGMIRYNSTLSAFEGYENGSWVSMGSGAGANAIDDLTDAIYDGSSLFLGNGAGANDDATSNGNVGVGRNALAANIAGGSNTAVGEAALRKNTSGNYNVALGHLALEDNTTGSENTAIGDWALKDNIGGSNNVAIGGGSQRVSTGASGNVSVGVYAIRDNLTGNGMVGLGYLALSTNVAKSRNTAVGYLAMRYADDDSVAANTNNTALGYAALQGSSTAANNTGTENTAVGANALTNNESGSNNTAIGTNAGDNITTGDNNIIIGYNVDAASATGDNQINIGNVITGDMSTGDIAIIGTAALTHPSGTTAQRPSTGVNGMIRYNSTLNEFEGYENGSWVSMGGSAGAIAINDLTDAYTDYTTDHNMFFGSTAGTSIASGGQYNVAIGTNAADAITTGDSNIAIGYNSLTTATTSGNNIGIGTSTLRDTTTGTANIAIGPFAMASNTTGSSNVTIGGMGGNQTGVDNVAIGSRAMNTNVAKARNTAVGWGAMKNMDNSATFFYTHNTAVGFVALEGSGTTANNTGIENTAFGSAALYGMSSGRYNTGIGRSAGQAATTGSENTFLGYQAGDNITTGSNNIIIGAKADAASATADNQINIGDVITGDMATGDIAIIGTAALAHPSGTTAERPTGVNGMIRYNSTTSQLEGYENGSWVSMGSGSAALTFPLDVEGETVIMEIGTGNIPVFVNAEANQNVFVGYGAGESVTPDVPTSGDGESNTFMGFDAGNATTTGAWNSFFGREAGKNNTTGGDNTHIGDVAGRANTTADGRTMIGAGAGYGNSGAANTFVGAYAGFTNSSGTASVLIGHNAGRQSTSASRVIMLGNFAGRYATANDNTLIGYQSGQAASGSELTGTDNTFVGYQTGFVNTSGSENTFIGDLSGLDNTTGQSNTFLGQEAGTNNTTGRDNTYIGQDAGHDNLAGSENTYVGDAAGYDGSSGSFNTTLGHLSAQRNTGDSNVFLGHKAADNNTTGDSNIIIGAGTDNLTATTNNYLNIGDVIIGDLSTGNIQVVGTAALTNPSGTTAQRPTTGVNGMIRYNSTLSKFEAYENSSWINMIGAAGSLWTDNTTHITRENFHILDTGLAAGSTTAVLDGDGTYSFYDPDKGAMRGGEITGSDSAWEDTNVGEGSFAWGENTQASGDNSVAFGDDTRAASTNSFAMGFGTSALGAYSTAFGFQTSAGTGAFAVGFQTAASGTSSAAIGNNTQSLGENSIATGRTTTASGLYSTAMGYEATAGSGTSGDGDGDSAFAIGLQTAAQATNPIITGDRSMVLYMDGGVTNANSTYDFTASDKFAIIGGEFQIDDVSSSANKGCIRYNSAATEIQYSHDCSTYVAMGSGGGGLWTDNTTHISRSNFHVLNTGLAAGSTTAGTDGNGSYAFFDPDKGALRGGTISSSDTAWQDANIGTNSFAWGENVTAGNAGSIAMGIFSVANGYASIAMGYETAASGSNSIALGDENVASGDFSTAIGAEVVASGNYSTALGTAAVASGEGAMVFGLTTAANAPATEPIVSGDESLGIFMGGQSGIDITDNNTMAVMGGDFIVGSYQLNDTGTTNQDYRMFFDISKGAFRAGLASGTQWDGANVGDNSFANGENNIASGEASVATGWQSVASGQSSEAMGSQATASGRFSFAMGKSITASGEGSAAFGLTTYANRPGTAPIVSGDESIGFFMGNQSGYDLTTSNRMALVGGDFLIDDDGTAGSQGCIRYLEGTGLQFSHDCSTYVTMGGGGSGTINDLSDAYTDYTTDNNMFIGSGAGASIASGGTQNIFIGESSGALITTSDGNTAVGFETLDINTSGEYQAAFGNRTLTNNTTGTKNAAFGAAAMHYNTDGSNNVALGHLAGRGNSGGSSPENSAFIGYYSGLNITTGINNTLLGYNTGATLTTGGNNILIGASTNVPASSTSNYLNIGNTIYGDLSNDYVGIGNSAPDVALDVTGDIEYTGTLTDVSDRRLKDNIKPLGQTLDRITQIDTYSFTMKDDKKGRTEFGVMAQELEEIFPTLVHTAKDEMGTKSVNYVGLIAPMIEATKELRAENTALKTELSGVKTTQAQTTQALTELSQQVALLNKMAGNNVGKASMMPYFMLLFGLLGGMGFMLLIQRKQQK